MPNLHLRPVPPGDVVPFPGGAREHPEVVVRQLRNIQNALQAGHGAYLGRQFFAEAAVWVIAQTAHDARDSANVVDTMLEDFDLAIRCYGLPMGMASAGTGGDGT